MHKEWLQKRVSVAEAEAAHLMRANRLGPDPLPFGFQNERWRALLAQMQEGDELWEFASPAQSWQHKAGRAGIALVRQGKVVTSIVTLMN